MQRRHPVQTLDLVVAHLAAFDIYKSAHCLGTFDMVNVHQERQSDHQVKLEGLEGPRDRITKNSRVFSLRP